VEAIVEASNNGSIRVRSPVAGRLLWLTQYRRGDFLTPRSTIAQVITNDGWGISITMPIAGKIERVSVDPVRDDSVEEGDTILTLKPPKNR